MRLVVTGREGQVATALAEAGAAAGIEVVRLGRPEFDLERPDTIDPALEAARPDVVVSTAAYTAVDQAQSEPDRARTANAVAPGVLARASYRLGAPIVHLSTDYVFDGTKAGPYTEGDPPAPVTVYGATKLAGEEAVAAAHPQHVILRTAWVYAPYGKNFVRTMLRLAESRDEVGVVADQCGCPTYAPDIADAVLEIATALRLGGGQAGLFHLAGAGEASWAEFAGAIFEQSSLRGGPHAVVRPIVTADYPTPAQRPHNSRLDCSKLADAYGVRLADWRDRLPFCLDRLVGRRGVDA